MKLERSETLELKYRALCWLRLEQRCAFIATECGSFSADVLGINEKKMIEVEVKVTESDLKADFKKPKHYAYLKTLGSTWQQQWVPNLFYFAVPEELVEFAKAYIAEKNAPYGVICLKDFKVVKRARPLHDRPPSSHAKFVCALRMGSALLRFHEAWI